jgi:D-sedoheptulose 7-phosphate isomerase
VKESTSGGIESLYPFLYSGQTDLLSLLQEVEQSTRAKAYEIVRLRGTIAAELSDKLAECAAALARCFSAGGKLMCCGNGGSSTDAQSVAQTFLYPPYGRALPALSLASDFPVITALGNDVGFDAVFSRQVAALAGSHDALLGISTSGNSINLLNAFDQGKQLGMLTIGLAGYDGGRMAESQAIDFLLVVPSSSVHRIQEAQTTLYHLLWELLQKALAGC